jgi:hypothetical protein
MSRAQSLSHSENVRGRAVVVQPEQGASYWQPVPANGHADPALTPATTGFDALSMGYQRKKNTPCWLRVRAG